MRGVAATLVAATVVVVAVACGDDTASSAPPKACTPGASIACTGAGGCAGGQACNADGSGYDPCVCAASDAGPSTGSDASSGPDAADGASAKPSYGELHVVFSLSTADGAATTCAANPSIASISATLTTDTGGASSSTSFACADGKGTVSGITFGTYELVVEALNASAQSVGHAPAIDVTFDAASCDAIVGGACIKNVPVNIKLD